MTVARIVGFCIALLIVLVVSHWILGPVPGLLVTIVAAVALVVSVVRRRGRR